MLFSCLYCQVDHTAVRNKPAFWHLHLSLLAPLHPNETMWIACSPLGTSPFLGDPRLQGNTLQFWHNGREVIYVWDPVPHLIPEMLSGVHVWTPSWPVHDLRTVLCYKSSRVTCSVACGLVLDIHKLSSKTPVAQGSMLSRRRVI